MNLLNTSAQKYKRDRSVIIGVLNDYVDNYGCPCNWDKFEYWVSKEHGRGWQDEYQNTLVQAALALKCFGGNSGVPRFDDHVTCNHCGRGWHFTSHEWRMLAYRDRLTPDNPRNFEFTPMVGEYFATAGFEPTNATILSIGQWYEFMSGKPYHTPRVERILSFLARFRNTARKHRPIYVQQANTQRQWILFALIGGAYIAKLASLQYSTYTKEEALSRVKKEAPMLEENIRAAWQSCKEFDAMDLKECSRQAEAAGTENGQMTALSVMYTLAKWHMSKSNCTAALTETQCTSMLPELNKSSIDTGSKQPMAEDSTR